MKTEHFLRGPLNNLNSVRSHSQLQHQRINGSKQHLNLTTSSPLLRLTSEQFHSKQRNFCTRFSDKDSVWSANSGRGKRIRSRNISMRSSKGIAKKNKTMDYTNYAYNEAVGRLKLMLADSYATPKGTSSYLRNLNEDSTDNYSDNMSVIERPIFSDISKYLSPSQRSRMSSYRIKKPTYSTFSISKENLALPAHYQSSTANMPSDYLVTSKPTQMPAMAMPPTSENVQAPVEIFNFIEKQEDYIEQLEKESKYCRNELTSLLGKVKDVINENEQLTETARSELAALGGDKHHVASPSSDSDEHLYGISKKSSLSAPRKKETSVKSPRYASAPNIVYEARISELEAELMQANIDLKRLKTENEELKRKLVNAEPVQVISGITSTSISCEKHRKQIEHLQLDKSALEETIRQLHKSLDETKSQQYNVSSKRYINDLMQMERSQSELEVKHLRDELDRQHERVRELQHEMARRVAEERANAERRYNNQVDQLGGDLSSQWEQVAKLQLELERQKRYETDVKRDLANRNSQIDELKMELRSNRSTFLTDMAQLNAEKQSLEQEITALRLQLDRGTREAKTEATRLNAEISSLRQRLDRGDADLLHSKREVLRLNDDISNLEKELTYGELKNEIRPTKKDLDKRISEMQEKHAETVNELEDMIQSQKQLMDKLTNECKILTNKLEDTTLKHNQDKQHLRELNEKLMERLKQIWSSYKELNGRCDDQRQLALLRAKNGSSTSDTESCQEQEKQEHFSSQKAHNLAKPLSTTSRPHLAQSTLHDPLPMTTPNLHHTVTSPYSAHQQPPTLSQQQHLHQLQQHLPTTSVTSQHMSLPVATQSMPPHSMITSLATITGSMTTMTKISRTTLAKEKSNNNREIQMSSPPIQSQPMRPSHPTILAAKTITNHNNSNEPQSIRTWPLPQVTTTPIIVATRATASNNMIRAHMTRAHTTNNTMTTSSNMGAPNMIQQEAKATTRMPEDKVDTRITQRPTTINQHINMIQQQHQLQLPLPTRHHQQTPTSNRPHHQHQQRYRQQSLQRHPHLPLESPRSLLAAQQQRAAINRERAVALWGQQVELEQSAAENPLCHNSLPRPQLRSSYTDQMNASSEMLDPFELEFSISSPSLMCSSSCSDTCTEMGMNEEFDSISDMSISPAHTTIQRIPPPSSSDVCDVEVETAEKTA